MVSTMNPITDPELIAQLESPNHGTPITDPRMIAQLEGSNQSMGQQQEGKMGFRELHPTLSTIADIVSPEIRVLQNVGAGLGSFGQGLYNTIPRMQQMVGANPSWQPSERNMSATMGLPNPNMAEKALQGVVQYAPYALLPGGTVAKAMVQGAVAGATQSENPLLGAGIGAVGAGTAMGALKGIGKIPGALRQIKSGFTPAKTLGDLLEKTSKILENLEETGKSMYEPISSNPMFKIAPAELNNYNKVIKSIPEKEIKSHLDYDARDLHNGLINDPTLDKIHWFKSHIKSELRDLELKQAINGKLGVPEKNTQIFLKRAGKALEKDMENNLGQLDVFHPEISNAYRGAQYHHATEVEPWRKADLELRKLGQDPTINKVINKFKTFKLSDKEAGANLPEEFKKTLETLKHQVINKKLVKGLGYGVAGLAGLSQADKLKNLLGSLTPGL